MNAPAEEQVITRPERWARIPDAAVEQMAAMYRDKGLTFRQLAEVTGWSYGAINRRLRLHRDVPIRGQGGSRAGVARKLDSPEVEVDREAMTADYLAGASLRTLGQRYGIGASSVGRRLHHWNVPMRERHAMLQQVASNRSLGLDSPRYEAVREDLSARYRAGESLQSLAEWFGIGSTRVKQLLVFWGVPLRRERKRRGGGG